MGAANVGRTAMTCDAIVPEIPSLCINVVVRIVLSRDQHVCCALQEL